MRSLSRRGARTLVIALLSIATIAACGCGGGTSHNAMSASFEAIDIASADAYTDPVAISDDGSTVVGSHGPEESTTAFRWQRETGVLELGTLPADDYSYPVDISADGKVIVGTSGNWHDYDQYFRWTPSGRMVAMAGFSNRMGIDAISADGHVMVGTVRDEDFNAEAVLWDSRGMLRLGTLTDGGSSYADAVTPDGRVVAGIASGPDGGHVAFRWEATTGMVGLGDTSNGTRNDWVRGISGDGQTICGRSWQRPEQDASASRVSDATLCATFPVCWTRETGMTVLPDLGLVPQQPPHCTSFWPGRMAVNHDGSVVVGYVGDGWLDRDVAMLWRDGKAHTIADLLDRGGVDVAGWKILHANAVTPDGQTIVGDGISPEGNRAAWVAMIPRALTALVPSAD